MRLRELKCKNCGATVKIEESATQAKCEFCHTTFAVEDAYHDGYKFEKGRMKAQHEQVEKAMENAKNIIGPIGKIFAAHYIISAVVGLIIFIIVITTIITIIISQTKDRTAIKEDGIVNDMNVHMSERYDVLRFNSTFEMYVGTEYGSSVGRLLDKIITNNKKDKNNQVKVEYKETLTKNPNEIQDLKKQFEEWTKYEVSFEYDDDGIIYLAKIEDKKNN